MKYQIPFGFVIILALVFACGSPVLSSAANGPAENEGSANTAQSSQFVAYYFHGNFRCATCRKLEAYSEEAITKGFVDQLASGTAPERSARIARVAA